jgi:hypothetical protein
MMIHSTRCGSNIEIVSDILRLPVCSSTVQLCVFFVCFVIDLFEFMPFSV